MKANKLRAKMVEANFSASEVSKALGMNRATFYRKMKSGAFSLKEVETMQNMLNLNTAELIEIFFTREGA